MKYIKISENKLYSLCYAVGINQNTINEIIELLVKYDNEICIMSDKSINVYVDGNAYRIIYTNEIDIYYNWKNRLLFATNIIEEE